MRPERLNHLSGLYGIRQAPLPKAYTFLMWTQGYNSLLRNARAIPAPIYPP